MELAVTYKTRFAPPVLKDLLQKKQPSSWARVRRVSCDIKGCYPLIATGILSDAPDLLSDIGRSLFHHPQLRFLAAKRRAADADARSDDGRRDRSEFPPEKIRLTLN